MTPQLAFQQNRWKLFHTVKEQGDVPGATLELVINFGYHGDHSRDHDDLKNWNSYKFMVNRVDTNFQAVSKEDWAEWYQTIVEHAGEEEADLWAGKLDVCCPD